ncbi:MAG: type II toxin-antitoxin system VapC family toxin [Acetobacteraceae bacterium]|nr:type II toxin-antitoxin system VapC family toxin [Pseudomonadota bacterium]
MAELAYRPIALDAETNSHAWSTTLNLAGRFGLTLYDAAYLEVAFRRALPLATLDRELRAAASALNVAVLGTA